jgi:hypothetical protein
MKDNDREGEMEEKEILEMWEAVIQAIAPTIEAVVNTINELYEAIVVCVRRAWEHLKRVLDQERIQRAILYWRLRRWLPERVAVWLATYLPFMAVTKLWCWAI